MRRGSTQTLTFSTGLDLSNVSAIDVSFAQHKKVVLSKSLEDVIIDGDTVMVNLSEDDTLLFDCHKNPLQIQMRIGIGDARFSSNIMLAMVESILKDGCLE